MPRSVRRRRDADDEEPKSSRYTDEDENSGDDEDEDRPSRRRPRGEVPRRGRRDEEEDDRPARRSARSRDDDEEDQDEPRRSRRGARDEDDDEDEAPRGRRARRSSNSARDRERGRRSRDDDDEDDNRPKAQHAEAQRGWDSWKKQKASTFTSADFQPEYDEEVLVKFVEDEPFHSYRQHWIDGLRSTNRKSWLCLRDLKQDCPLCDSGIDVRAFSAFNIAVLDEEGNPELKVWSAGSGVSDQLEKKAKAKTGPLTKEYYSVTRSKSGASKKGPVQYTIDVVRERDLESEWGFAPLDDAELDALEEKMHDADYFRYPQRAELRAIARELGSDED